MAYKGATQAFPCQTHHNTKNCAWDYIENDSRGRHPHRNIETWKNKRQKGQSTPGHAPQVSSDAPQALQFVCEFLEKLHVVAAWIERRAIAVLPPLPLMPTVPILVFQ